MAVIVPAIAGKVIHIGRAGENLATTVRFDVSDWIEEFGDAGAFTLFVQQGGGNTYPQELVQDQAQYLVNDCVDWNVIDSNTATVGLGKCELSYALPTNVPKRTVDGYYYESNFYYDENHTNKIEPNTLLVYIDLGHDNTYYYFTGAAYEQTTEGGTGTTQFQIVKSIIYDIAVTNSLDAEAGAAPPSAIQSWLDHMTELTTEIENAEPNAEKAERYAKGTVNGVAVTSGEGYHDNAKYYADRIQSLTAGTVTTGSPGSSAAAQVNLNESDNTLTLDLTIPRGAQGNPGNDGTDGVSPTLESDRDGKDTYIYYTDATHPTKTLLATLHDGQDGSGAGTVTSVGVSNATNGGLTISGSPITSYGAITIGHSNVLTNAQATQAVYPISIDKNGHISGYGTAVTIPSIASTSSLLKGDGSGGAVAASSSDYIAPPSSPSSGNVLTYNGSSWVAAAPASGLPAQSVSTDGYYLMSSNSSAAWVDIGKGAANGLASLNSDSKIEASQASAEIKSITGSTLTLGPTYAGCLVLMKYSGSGNSTITIEFDEDFIEGTEIEIMNYSSNSVIINADLEAVLYQTYLNGKNNNSATLSDQYTSAVLKLIENEPTYQKWVIQGAVEVAEVTS